MAGDRPDHEEEDLSGYISDGGQWQEPPFIPNFQTAIVVDNLPKVPKDKYEKLMGFVAKIYGQLGDIVEGGLVMPLDDSSNSTLGFAFINFKSPEAAEKAVQATNNWSFDKAHTLKVNRYVDLVSTMKHPETYEPQAPAPFRQVDGLYDWLKDGQFRDQLVIRHGKETEVFWAEGNGPPDLVYGGEREKESGKCWCDLYVAWSNTGAYLLTFHVPGVALWAGPNFTKVARLAHPGVQVAQWSKTDRYLVTYSYGQSMPNEPPGNIQVWDVKSTIAQGRPVLLHRCPVEPFGKHNFFKWSHDDKYVAIGKSKYLRSPETGEQQPPEAEVKEDPNAQPEGQISIFEAPSMRLLDRKSLRAEGLRGFDWSPKGNMIAYWAPEKHQQPARVVLVEVPSKNEIRRKPLYHVEHCELFWQSEGEYLGIKVTHKKQKGKKKVSLELFRVKEPGVALEMLEIEPTPVRDFAWEPAGHRFAIIHGEDPIRSTVSFYSMRQGDKKEVTLLHRLEDSDKAKQSRNVNKLLWAPNGGFIVLANLSDNSILEFFDADSFTTTARREELMRVDYLKWDPSGRFLADAIQQPIVGAYYKYTYNNGFRIWTFQGQLVCHIEKGEFYQFEWRPRPPPLLSGEQQRKVRKDLRKFERRFDKEDREKEQTKREAEWRRKGELRRQFRAFYQRRWEEFVSNRPRLVEEQKGYDSEDESNYDIKVVSRKMVPIGPAEEVPY